MKNLTNPLRTIGLLALILLSIFSESNARTYYSRQSGLWSVASTWSTVTYGNATNAGTYPQRGDVVFIGDGHNISMNVNAVVASVTVGQGASGTLMYSNYLTFNMVIAGNLTVNAGATFGYAFNSSRAHSLFISGSLTNNGIVDLYYDANDYVNMTFNSRTNSIVSGTGTWDLNRVSVVKSTLTTYKVEATANGFENAIRDLVVTYGTFAHNNRFTYSVNPTGGNFTVGPDAIMQVMDGVLHLSPNNDYVYLQGQLSVTAGTMRIGSSAGNQGLRYDQNGAGVPAIDVTGGTLTVYGGITYRAGNASDPVRFSQSNGDVVLNTGSTGTSLEVFNIDNSASSRFTFSGGTITLQKPSLGGSSVSDFNLCGSSGTITASAGTVVFGNASTTSGTVFNFTPYATPVYPNFKVSGPAAAVVTVRPSNNSTSDFKLISLNIEANKVFDVRSIAGTTGDSRNMTLTDNFDGLHAFYNDGTFTPRTGTVTLSGAEGLWVGGSAITAFYNFTVNNTLGILLNQEVQVSNTLFLSDGVVYSSATNKMVCLNGASSNIGSSLSYVDGPMQQRVANTSPQTINLPVGKNGAYRPIILAVQHTTSASIDYTAEVYNVSARAMSYTLPGTLGWVSDMRYYTITRSAGANLSNARVTLSYGADDFVADYPNLRIARDNGSSSWLDLGGVGTSNGSGSITSSNFAAFNTYFTLANALNGINPLPVEFLSFNAKPVQNHVLLDWSTATEVNSDFYEVERSRDGVNFKPIGKVTAAGFSTTVKSYSFKDNAPLNGVNYYRLKQVDRNGTFEYTNILSVVFNLGVMVVYPNPVADRNINVNIPDGDESTLRATLYDITGKSVMSAIPVNLFNNKGTIQLDANIPAGTYLLKMSDATGNSWQEKVMVSL